MSTSPLYRSDLRDGRLTIRPWNRHQIQDMTDSARFAHISDVRYLISDICICLRYLISDICCLPGAFVYILMFEIAEAWDFVWSSTVSEESAFHNMINFLGQAITTTLLHHNLSICQFMIPKGKVLSLSRHHVNLALFQPTKVNVLLSGNSVHVSVLTQFWGQCSDSDIVSTCQESFKATKTSRKGNDKERVSTDFEAITCHNY